MRSAVLASLLALSLLGCSKKPTDGGAGSGSGSSTTAAVTGSGSAPAGSGSAPAGSGSAPAGSGSDDAGSAGSGSDEVAAGSGSGSDASSGVDADGVPTGPFDKLDKEGKVAVMKKRVMPAMKKAFQEFDPKEYAKFTCKTCHGKDPEGVKYKMPSPELPKLDFKELEEGHDAKIADFMSKVVKPEMAKILGEAEYSKDTPNGFGCLHCHLEKK